jgi:hypothetical protein
MVTGDRRSRWSTTAVLIDVSILEYHWPMDIGVYHNDRENGGDDSESELVRNMKQQPTQTSGLHYSTK